MLKRIRYFCPVYQEITLKKGKESAISRKHPWIFSGAIASNCESLEDGDLVRVISHKKEFLAVGHFQHGSISVRILSFEDELINAIFWFKRVDAMVKLRKNLGLFSIQNNICRLCHGEGDELPGLVIDYYNGVTIIQCHSVGMLQHLHEISAAIQNVLEIGRAHV